MFLFAGVLLAAAAVANSQSCGGSVQVIEGQTSVIRSPNYPSAYPNNARCVWTISGPAGKGLYFSANAFNLEGGSCSYDYVEINGNKFCGTSFANGLSARSPVTVSFVSDGSVSASGFEISIDAGPAVTEAGCGGDIVVEEGKTSYVVSPGYPLGYQNNQNCQYTISGPADKALQFSTAFFDTEASYDYLELTETVNGVAKSLGRFSGSSGPNKLRTSTNQVTGTFRSDSSATKRGFNVTVKPDICPGQTVCPNAPTQCISHNQFCDGIAQCPEGADEEHCNAECGLQPIQPNLEEIKDGKIVGGVEAVPHSWPWQVAMLSSSGSQICGGSLIHRNWVMTAAHCCAAYSPSPSSYKLRLGTHNLGGSEASSRVHNIKRLVMHPNYASRPATKFDFCLLELEEPAQFGRETVPVCLATEADGRPGTRCFVTGWGNTGPRAGMKFDDYINLVKQDEAGKIPKEYANLLRGTQLMNQVDVNIDEQTYCNTQYGGVIEPNMICASKPGKDTCQGDSGGPLVCQREGKTGEFALVGVTSWGRGCASPGYPGVYGRISEVLPWISETMFSV